MKFTDIPTDHQLAIQTAVCLFSSLHRFALDLFLQIAKKLNPPVSLSKSKSPGKQLFEAITTAEWEQVPNCYYAKGEIVFAVTHNHVLKGFLLYNNTSTTYSLLSSNLAYGTVANALRASLKGKAPVSIGILGPQNVVLATYRYTPK